MPPIMRDRSLQGGRCSRSDAKRPGRNATARSSLASPQPGRITQAFVIICGRASARDESASPPKSPRYRRSRDENPSQKQAAPPRESDDDAPDDALHGRKRAFVPFLLPTRLEQREVQRDAIEPHQLPHVDLLPPVRIAHGRV